MAKNGVHALRDKPCQKAGGPYLYCKHASGLLWGATKPFILSENYMKFLRLNASERNKM